MPRVDLDFQRYVERRRGAHQAQTREGAHYAYAGDLRYLRTLDRLRPVRLALEAAGRMWASLARGELVKSATRASRAELTDVYAVALRAAQTLHVEMPPVYVLP